MSRNALPAGRLFEMTTVMAGQQELEAVRQRGFGVAYRMLGSVAEAEDIAQEAMLRLTRANAPIEEPLAWITTVATRLSIDFLRLARVRRESYVGPWLPEPLIDDESADVAARVELTESLSQAFLVVLERLSPVERAAFLLREIFDYDYAQIATVIDRTEVNTRQLVTRAKKHLDADRPRFDPDEGLREQLLERFMAAAEAGDVRALEAVLAKDAAAYADGGGKAEAAPEPVLGAAPIAHRFVELMKMAPQRYGALTAQRVKIGGQPARIVRSADGELLSVISVEVVAGRIQTIHVVRNPDKLRHL